MATEIVKYKPSIDWKEAQEMAECILKRQEDEGMHPPNYYKGISEEEAKYYNNLYAEGEFKEGDLISGFGWEEDAIDLGSLQDEE